MVREGHKAAHEYALPKPGRIPREEAWQVVVAYAGLIRTIVNLYARKLTEQDTKLFAGMRSNDLFDALIGAAYEEALVAVETRQERFKISVTIATYIKRRLPRTAKHLNQETGPGIATAPKDMPDVELPSVEEAVLTGMYIDKKLKHKPRRAKVPEVLVRAAVGEWVDAGAWVQAREDYILDRMSIGMDLSTTQQLGSSMGRWTR